MGKERQNLSGRIFGRWTVQNENKLETVPSNTSNKKSKYRNYIRWKCLCTCGNIKWIRHSVLLSKNSQSCGCLFLKQDAIFNNLFRRYINDAKLRNYEFKLSRDEVIALFKGNCSYCGISPATKITLITESHSRSFNYNGIDRVDNTKGYTIDNAVSCCQNCNFMKRAFSVNEFINWVNLVYTNINK